ncbi:MAG: arginase family protein, partial [Methanobrevibacter sp.]|nr:arginase family protein [Methanobrevibacter sp.]
NITSFLAKDLFDDFDILLEKLDSIEGKVYISIDMDAVDPAFAPSVGNPTPNGLHPVDIENIFEVLANNEKIDLIGFDLVEVASDRLGDITAVLAAKIIYDFLSLFA